MVANVTAKPVEDRAEIVKLLVAQITGTVRWRQSVAYLAANGVNRIVEVGSGKVLAGLVRRILPFRSIPEKEILLYAVLNRLPLHHEAECPYAARSHRFMLRDMLVQLEGHNPGTRHALVKGAERLKPILQQALPAIAVASCPECGEPTSGERCMACALRS